MTQPRNPDCPDNPECNVDVDSAGDRFCTVCGLGWGNIGDDDPDDATRERAEALQAWAGPPEAPISQDVARDMLSALRMADALIANASDAGLLDLLARDMHPDEINAACDAIRAAIARATEG